MRGGALRTAIHARVMPDAESGYVATCDEIAVVTEGEDLAALGFAAAPIIIVTLELAPTQA